jgi:hypothetical protein
MADFYNELIPRLNLGIKARRLCLLGVENGASSEDRANTQDS